MKESHRRRWMLLLFGSMVAGASGQSAVAYARALDCYHARRYTEARTRFGQVAVQRPGDPEIDFSLGRLALWFDDTAAALSHLERAAQTAPTEARIQNALGDAYGLMAQTANVLAKLGWALNCRKAYGRAVALEPANVAYRWSLLGFYCVASRLVGGGSEKARAEAA